MNAEALARIDSDIERAQIALNDAHRCQALHITPATGTVVRRLEATLRALREARALIPEPPTEHQAIWADTYLCSICKQRITLNWVNDEHGTWVHLTGDSDA